MQKAKTKWEDPDEIPVSIDLQLKKYPTLIRHVLFNRGITTADLADEFLRAKPPKNYEEKYNAFRIKGVDKAVEILHTAITEGKKIVVFGDYDVDGVTASVLLVQLLQKYGADVHVFIPNRFDEGYGLSFDALDEVLKMNPDLIVTVDCGVRSVDEVALAKKNGVDVIITDHHQPHAVLPPADVIICTKQPGDDYPYKGLAGVGVAYKLAAGLLEKHPITGVQADDWIDLVAVGTVADIAPLDGENRWLVRRGLRKIRLGARKGLLALANVSGTNINKIGAEDIGFRIGPRLNAAGRLDSAYLSFNLLMAETTKEAGQFALELDQMNRDRRRVTVEIERRSDEMYDPEKNKNFLFFWSKEFHEGVVGLAASKLVEKYNRPAIVGVEKDGVVFASCRSIEALNITSALDDCEKYLVQHGGHAMAAGLRIKVDDIDTFMVAFDRVCSREYENAAGVTADQVDRDSLIEEALRQIYRPEAEVSFSDLEPKNLDFYEVLEPLGECNPYPLFITRDVKVKWVKRIGSEGEHLRLGLNDGKMNFNAVAFRFGEFADVLKDADGIDILYAFELNEYNGNKSLQLRLVDVHFPEDAEDAIQQKDLE